MLIGTSPTKHGHSQFHSSIGPTRHLIRSIPGSREVRCTVFIPFELLCTNVSSSPSGVGISHAMIDDPAFETVWRCRETCLGVSTRIRESMADEKQLIRSDVLA